MITLNQMWLFQSAAIHWTTGWQWNQDPNQMSCGEWKPARVRQLASHGYTTRSECIPAPGALLEARNHMILFKLAVWLLIKVFHSSHRKRWNVLWCDPTCYRKVKKSSCLVISGVEKTKPAKQEAGLCLGILQLFVQYFRNLILWGSLERSA